MTALPAIPRERPLRILLVCHYYPPHLGGIERVVREKAVRLAALGHEVVVLTSAASGGSGTRAGRGGRAVEDGVRVVRVPAWNIAERRAGVPFPLFSPSLLAHALRLAGRADVVHVHDCFYFSSWAAGLASLVRRRPLVVTQHVTLVDHPSAAVRAIQKMVYRTAGRALLRRARRVFTLNGRVTDFVLGLGASPEETRVLANGVDQDLYRPAVDEAERAHVRARYGLDPDAFLVLYVGRLVPKKGIGLLLEAFDAVVGAQAPVPPRELVVVGTGDDAAVRAHPAVRYLGGRSGAEVAELYRACDAFALPSVSEGFPLVIQEAMSSGIPVVTTDDPAYAPYGLVEAGVVLIPRNTAALGVALRALAVDTAERARLGKQAAAYAAERFSWSRHVEALLTHYRRAARSRR